MAVRDPSFAPPAADLQKQTLAPAVVAAAPSVQQGLALDHKAKVPDGLTSTITGQVDSAASAPKGSGYSVAKGGTGIYNVTFTTPFAATPTVIATMADTTIAIRVIGVSSVTTSGFTAQIANGGTAEDRAWNFIALATV